MKLRVKNSTKRVIDNDEVKILFAGSIVDWDETDAGGWIRVADSDGVEFDLAIADLEAVQEIVAKPEIHINSSVTPEDVAKAASEEVHRRIAQVGEKFKNVSEEDSNNSPEPEWLMHVKALEQWALELEDRIGNLEDKVVKEEIKSASVTGSYLRAGNTIISSKGVSIDGEANKSYQIPVKQLRLGQKIKIDKSEVLTVTGLEAFYLGEISIGYVDEDGYTNRISRHADTMVTVVG